jgi:DNA-binding SARP family transcriptional activator
LTGILGILETDAPGAATLSKPSGIPSIHIRLFGRPSVLFRGSPVEIATKKAVALLAYLVTTGKTHSRERLAALLWPEASDDVARTSLRQALRALKDTPLEHVLLVDRTSIGVSDDIHSDVRAFQTYFARARDLSAPYDRYSLDNVSQMQALASLYHDDFLADFNLPSNPEWEDWQQFRRIEFQYQATQLFEALARYYANQRLVDSGLQMVSRWLELDPYNESGHSVKMGLFALSQQTERAIEQYHLLVRLLAREQAKPPSAQTQALYEQIRSGAFQTVDLDFARRTSIRSILPKPVPQSPTFIAQQLSLRQQLLSTAATLVVIDDTNDKNRATLLMAQLAHDCDLQAHFSDGILWARLDGDLDFVLRLWMDALRVSILKSTSKLEHLVWQFHNALRGKRLLILLEQVETAEQVRMLRPGAGGCALVVTPSRPDVVSGLKRDEHETSFILEGLTEPAGEQVSLLPLQ